MVASILFGNVFKGLSYMEIEEIVLYLKEHGSEQTRRIYGNYGSKQ